MRITDRFKYDLFLYQFNTVKGSLDRVQEQIASQKKVNRPSDDPVAFSTYVSLNSESLLYEQLDRNIQRVTTFGRVYETCFGTMKDLLADTKEVAINHASGSMDDALRETAVTQIESIIEQLVTLGNTVVGDTYVFGGKQSTNAPFRLNPDYSVDFLVAEGSEAANQIYVDRGNTAQYNISGKEAFYDRTKTVYANPANEYSGEVTLNTTDLAYVVDASNNVIYRDGTAITLTQGTYTGTMLASEIQARLNDAVPLGQAGYVVAFDASTRRFTIANNTISNVTFDWSDSGSTAAQVLGFNAVDSTLTANGGRDTSDMDTGKTSFTVEMSADGLSYNYSVDGGPLSGPVVVNGGTFIDGSNVANETNRGVKITFSTTEDLGSATFEIKDYSIFETLKNLRDALLSNNTTWSRDNIAQIGKAVDIVNSNTAKVGVNLQTMETLTEANDARQQRTSEIISETINADLAQLAVEYNSLSTVYQSLMYSVSKMQELGLLNYLS